MLYPPLLSTVKTKGKASTLKSQDLRDQGQGRRFWDQGLYSYGQSRN